MKTEKLCAMTFTQCPGTGDILPKIMLINENTSVGEILQWYKKYNSPHPIDNLRIVEIDENGFLPK